MSGDGSVFEALSAKLKQLANGAYFTVAELTATGVIVWTVSRDDKGTPAARYQELTGVPDPETGALADFDRDHLTRLLGRHLLLVTHPAVDYPDRLLALLPDEFAVPAHECQTPLKDHVRGVITVTPLRVGYELVVLRQGQDGRLTMDLRQLIPQDACSGYSEDFTVRCAPTDERGTTFAVVIRDRNGGITGAASRPRPVEIQSAKIPPGEYRVNAELVRPGHVEFNGFPTRLGRDSRTLREIVQTVPERLPRPRRAHLICLLEVSDAELLEHRVERLEELINAAEASGGELEVSLVTYGPHSVQRTVPEEAAAVVAWATRSDLALRKLGAVKKRAAPDNEYPRAAQLECALREVARMFADETPGSGGSGGRTVLVTAGARPPHPDRVDIYTEIIPCPDRTNWKRTLNDLYDKLPSLKFGALCNVGAVGNVWSSLGKDAIEEVEVVDVPAFAEKLGLHDSVRAVPFPLI